MSAASASVSFNSERTEESARLHLSSFLQDYPLWLSLNQEDVDRDHEFLFQMLEKHPSLAGERFKVDHGETFPLGFMLAARAPLEMIRKVCQMNHEAVELPDKGGFFPLHDAMVYRCSHEVTAFLLDKYTEAAAKRTQQGYLPIEFLLNRGDYDEENFSSLFQLLFQAYPPDHWEENHQNWRDVLGILLMSPKTPSELLVWLAKREKGQNGSEISFRGGNLDEFSYPTLIKNLIPFVPMLKCSVLKLQGHGRRMDGAFLGQLFSDVEFSPHLAVAISSFEISLPSSFEEFVTGWRSCQIAALAFNACVMPAEDLKHLFQSFQLLPKLKQLLLECSSLTKISFTASIIDFLEATTELEKLVLLGYGLQIDVSKLSHALQKSKSTAFVSYQDAARNSPYQEIAYHSAMNLHGRAIITSPKATTYSLVAFLSVVEEFSCPEIPNLKESLWYGLLRLAPGLWAASFVADSGPQKKKRPVEELTQSQNKKMK